MNIFVLDTNPKRAAQFLCDKHISKMAVETTQMLYTAHWATGGQPTGPKKLVPYKPTHANHPCSKWARDSKANYKWLVKHGIAISEEYTARYRKIHACAPHLKWLSEHVPNIQADNMTGFAMAFYAKDPAKHNLCLVPGDPVQSYRNYYKMDKARFAVWKRSTKNPYWW